jgi:hypothetical protein
MKKQMYNPTPWEVFCALFAGVINMMFRGIGIS